MTKYASLLFICGLAFLLAIITMQLPLGHAPTIVGNGILSNSANEVGAANVVTSVVLAYRGLDTLGELAILFTSATIVGLILSTDKSTVPLTKSTNSQLQQKEVNPTFIVVHALDLLYPLLLVVGFYIIFHGHLTPGGGFQGGVIIATAFFMDVLARPNLPLAQRAGSKARLAWIESLSGAAFILIGLFALLNGSEFLKPLLEHGQFGNLWSAGTLPFLYLAVGLKVGAELSSLLLNLFYNQREGA